MTRRHVVLVAAALIGVVAAPPALASAPKSPSCWGAASADFAQQSPGALGEHASQPPEVDLGLGRPGRAGIGNVARLLGGDHPGDAASLLGFDC